MTRRPVRLRVEVPAAPRPALLRGAIAARIAGHAFPSHAEDAVGVEVAAALREQLAEEGRPLSERPPEGPAWR